MLATFQVFSGHMWLMANELNSAEGHFHPYRKFYWTLLVQTLSFAAGNRGALKGKSVRTEGAGIAPCQVQEVGTVVLREELGSRSVRGSVADGSVVNLTHLCVKSRL